MKGASRTKTIAPMRNREARLSSSRRKGRPLFRPTVEQSVRLSAEKSPSYQRFLRDRLCGDRIRPEVAFTSSGRHMDDLRVKVPYSRAGSGGAMGSPVSLRVCGQFRPLATRKGDVTPRRGFGSAGRPAEKRYEAGAAMWNAFFGNPPETRQRLTAALELSKGRDVEYGAAFALALAGDSARSQTLANDLEKRFPEDTSVQFNYLPALRALFALNHTRQPIRISSPCGKTPTPKSRSLNKLKQSTQD